MIEFLVSESRVLLQAMVAWTVCAAALAWGGGPERVLAITWLIVFELALRILPLLLGLRIQLASVDLWFISLDLLACGVMLAVALYANRSYTLWIAAMQLLAVTAHVARGLVESISPVAYALMIAVPGWLQLFALAIGLACHILRKRKYGPYRSWRISKPSFAIPAELSPLQNQAVWQGGKQPSWRDDAA